MRVLHTIRGSPTKGTNENRNPIAMIITDAHAVVA
jgi:hypothetical protein